MIFSLLMNPEAAKTIATYRVKFGGFCFYNWSIFINFSVSKLNFDFIKECIHLVRNNMFCFNTFHFINIMRELEFWKAYYFTSNIVRLYVYKLTVCDQHIFVETTSICVKLDFVGSCRVLNIYLCRPNARMKTLTRTYVVVVSFLRHTYACKRMLLTNAIEV